MSSNTTQHPRKIRYSYRKQISAIWKLLFSVFIADPLAIWCLFLAPVGISLIWILLVSQGVLPQVPDASRFENPINRWYEFSFFVIGFAGLFYISIKFAQFRKTILFRRILIGGINKFLLSLLLLLFYWMMTIFVVVIKIGLLFYYSKFRDEMSSSSISGLVLGFLFFSLTSVALAFFFAHLPTSSTTTISIISLATLVFSLMMAGAILDIEYFLIDYSKISKASYGIRDLKEKEQDYALKLQREIENVKNAYVQHYETINFKTKVWRWITFASPYQPSVLMIKSAHLNQDWKEVGGLRYFDETGLNFYRPMVYSNYGQAVAVNLGWIFGLSGLGIYLLRRG